MMCCIIIGNYPLTYVITVCYSIDSEIQIHHPSDLRESNQAGERGEQKWLGN